MSSLPLAQFCGQAPALSSVGSGRAAAIGRAGHARFANAPEASALMAALTPEEREEVLAWKRPADVDIPMLADAGAPFILTYAVAEKELEVGLNSRGEYCRVDDPDCVTVGHLDFAWCADIDGERWAFVVDVKRSEYTTTEGPATLQLQAYGLAYASKVGASVYLTGQWDATEGRYWWADAPVRLDDFDAMDIIQRVLAAAQNVGGDYAMGPHCRGCYGRLRCPAYVLPPAMAATQLAAFTAIGADITGAQAAELLMVWKRVQDTGEYLENELKERVRRGLVVTDGNGKVWKPTECQGRMSLSKKLLEQAGHDPEQFMERGKPYDRWSWVREGKD